ncbi:hypothetical protein ColTof3_05522 [Colletotrichum tofieldiae]|nr:hypothetical protein ColTof3_05522 [Colletotrichum tofieldiae]
MIWSLDRGLVRCMSSYHDSCPASRSSSSNCDASSASWHDGGSQLKEIRSKRHPDARASDGVAPQGAGWRNLTEDWGSWEREARVLSFRWSVVDALRMWETRVVRAREVRAPRRRETRMIITRRVYEVVKRRLRLRLRLWPVVWESRRDLDASSGSCDEFSGATWRSSSMPSPACFSQPPGRGGDGSGRSIMASQAFYGKPLWKRGSKKSKQARCGLNGGRQRSSTIPQSRRILRIRAPYACTVAGFGS